jgi:hypothetical protein
MQSLSQQAKSSAPNHDKNMQAVVEHDLCITWMCSETVCIILIICRLWLWLQMTHITLH